MKNLTKKAITEGMAFKAGGVYVSKFDWERKEKDGTVLTVRMFQFEYYGGTFMVEVNAEQYKNPPEIGSEYRLVGKLRKNMKTGKLRLELVKHDAAQLTSQELLDGLVLIGAAVVADCLVFPDRETNEPRYYVNLRWLGGQQGFFVDAEQFESCEKDMIVVVTGSIKTKIVEASAGTFCDLKFKIDELEEAAVRESGPGPAAVKDVA